MKNRLMAAIAVVCLSLSAAGCSWDSLLNKIQAGLTKADELVLANQSVFINACNAGGVAHEQLRAQIDAGIIKLSAKDDANELTLYAKGIAVCYPDPNRPNTIVPPATLSELFARIPSIQAWAQQVAVLLGKVQN